MLAATPASLDLSQTILPARLQGPLQWFRHGDGGNPVWRFLHHKEWYYVGANTKDAYVAAAIVSLGYLGKAFVYVVDKQSGEFIWHKEVLVPPGPWLHVDHQADGTTSSFLRHPLLSVAISRDASGHMTLVAKDTAHQVRLFLRRDAHTQALVAANQLEGGITNLTEKTLGYQTSGEMRSNDRSPNRRVLNGVAGVDYTNGFLPRHTEWRWAFFVSQHPRFGHLGINLVQGFNGACECAIFAGEEIIPVDEAVVEFNARSPMQPWSIRSRCGRVNLTLQPIAMHADDTDLKVIRARFNQPIGVYHGTVRIADEDITISDVVGVAEKQDVIW